MIVQSTIRLINSTTKWANLIWNKIGGRKTRKESRIYLSSKKDTDQEHNTRWFDSIIKRKHRSWERFKKFGEGNLEVNIILGEISLSGRLAIKVIAIEIGRKLELYVTFAFFVLYANFMPLYALIIRTNYSTCSHYTASNPWVYC